jgi:hypothetical protein
MIYNPENGAVFGIEFGKLFNNIKMPNFGDIFDSLVGAILPEPGSGWFADKLYRFFPDLKELAQKAADMGSGVHTQGDVSSTVTIPDLKDSAVKFSKEEKDVKKKADGLKFRQSSGQNNIVFTQGGNTSTVSQSSNSISVGPLHGTVDPIEQVTISGALALRMGKG